jgi:hypothetical protein
VIARNWPDLELWAIQLLRPLFSGVVIANQKPTTAAPYRQLIVTALPGGKDTAISRTYRLNLEAWVTRSSGASDLIESFALASGAANAIERSVGGFILTVDIETGPMRVHDPLGDPEFHEVSLILTVLGTT